MAYAGNVTVLVLILSTLGKGLANDLSTEKQMSVKLKRFIKLTALENGRSDKGKVSKLFDLDDEKHDSGEYGDSKFNNCF
jgi:hypothetical protein